MSKGWIVSHRGGDEYHYLVWAETRGQARVQGQRIVDADFTDVLVKRAPTADGLTRETTRWWLDNGYFVECLGCCRRIHPGGETEDDEDDIVHETVFEPNGDAYCSALCRFRDKAGDMQRFVCQLVGPADDEYERRYA